MRKRLFRTFGEKGLAPGGSAPEIPGKRGNSILLIGQIHQKCGRAIFVLAIGVSTLGHTFPVLAWLVGFVLTAGLIGLIGLVVVWARRDAAGRHRLTRRALRELTCLRLLAVGGAIFVLAIGVGILRYTPSAWEWQGLRPEQVESLLAFERSMALPSGISPTFPLIFGAVPK